MEEHTSAATPAGTLSYFFTKLHWSFISSESIPDSTRRFLFNDRKALRIH